MSRIKTFHAIVSFTASSEKEALERMENIIECTVIKEAWHLNKREYKILLQAIEELRKGNSICSDSAFNGGKNG